MTFYVSEALSGVPNLAEKLEVKERSRAAIQAAAYYAKNKEKVRARISAYVARNKEAVAMRTAAYRKKNKEAIRIQATEYRKRSAVKIANGNADYRLKNREAIRMGIRDHYSRNKEALSAKKSAYYFAHPELTSQRRDRSRAWRQANPEKVSSRNNARRARVIGCAIGDLQVINKWVRCWRSKLSVACYWCGTRGPGKKCHSDHIISLINGGSHSIGNLCVSCARCNLTKNAKTLSRWNSTLKEPVLF